MLKAATARGLGPCGPRQLGSGTPPHPQLRSGHRHQAPAAAPPPSPLPGVHPALHPRSTVTTNSSPVRGTHGGSCSSGPQSRAPAQPIGGHLSRFSLLGMHGQMNSPPTTLFGRSAQLQTRAAKGDAATGATSPSGGDENDSLSALFKRFRNNLDAPIALEKEYEGSTTVGGKGDVEGRIVKKVVELEKRILERMREQEQRLAAVAEAQGQRTKEEVKKLVEVRRAEGGSASALPVHWLLAVYVRLRDRDRGYGRSRTRFQDASCTVRDLPSSSVVLTSCESVYMVLKGLSCCNQRGRGNTTYRGVLYVVRGRVLRPRCASPGVHTDRTSPLTTCITTLSRHLASNLCANQACDLVHPCYLRFRDPPGTMHCTHRRLVDTAPGQGS